MRTYHPQKERLRLGELGPKILVEVNNIWCCTHFEAIVSYNEQASKSLDLTTVPQDHLAYLFDWSLVK